MQTPDKLTGDQLTSTELVRQTLIQVVEHGFANAPIAFSMREWKTPYTDDINCHTRGKTCTTVCCIGGSLGVLTGIEDEAEQAAVLDVDLKEWFTTCFPYGGAAAWAATPAQAAQALRILFETGKCGWGEVFPGQ